MKWVTAILRLLTIACVGLIAWLIATSVVRENKIKEWCAEHNGILLESAGPTECVKSIEYFKDTP